MSAWSQIFSCQLRLLGYSRGALEISADFSGDCVGGALVVRGRGKGVWRGSLTEGFEVLDSSGHKLVCGR